jgi:hypothetical protein
MLAHSYFFAEKIRLLKFRSSKLPPGLLGDKETLPEVRMILWF